MIRWPWDHYSQSDIAKSILFLIHPNVKLGSRTISWQGPHMSQLSLQSDISPSYIEVLVADSYHVYIKHYWRYCKTSESVPRLWYGDFSKTLTIVVRRRKKENLRTYFQIGSFSPMVPLLYEITAYNWYLSFLMPSSREDVKGSQVSLWCATVWVTRPFVQPAPYVYNLRPL